MTDTADDKYKLRIESAWKKYEEKDLSGAKKLCILIKDEFPDKLGASYLLGIIYFDKKQYVESAKELKTALKNDNEKKAGGFINYWLGKNYGNQTFSEDENPLFDKDSSRKYFEQALEYENYPEDTIYQLQYIYQNNYKLIQLFKNAIKKFPENLNFVLTLSDTYFKIGQVENQEKVLLTAKEKFSSTHLLYELSKIEIEKKNFKESRELIKRAKELNGKPSASYILS
ncbi:MAG: hypothetical protein K9H64_22070 [Bacteroidales bacterium]|nr:hypothetical protein [Bacteroidales bacterium]MCF8458716.1 hypothetical protein [Bacteroidales bacterium]